MAYNLTFVNGTSNGWVNFISGFNVALSGLPATMLVFILWIGLFAALKNYDTIHDLMVSSFGAVVLGSVFLFLGLVAWWVVVLPVVGLVVGILVNAFR